MSKIEKLAEPQPINSDEDDIASSIRWSWELAILLRYVSILVVVAINKIKEKS